MAKTLKNMKLHGALSVSKQHNPKTPIYFCMTSRVTLGALSFMTHMQVAYRRGALARVIVVVEHAPAAKISQEQVVVKKQYLFKEYISRFPIST